MTDRTELARDLDVIAESDVTEVLREVINQGAFCLINVGEGQKE